MNRSSLRLPLIALGLCITFGFSSYLATTQIFQGIASSAHAENLLQQPANPEVSTGAWSTYQGDLRRSGFNSYETIINARSAARLALKWQYQAGGSINSQPVVAFGKIFWGSWDGYEHATDFRGAQVWSTYLGQAQHTHCPPSDAGVGGTATFASISIKGVMQNVLFVASGTAHFFALNAKTGAILWDRPLASSPKYMIWGGSAVFNGSVYVGVSSYAACPLVQGKLVKMDAATGAVQATFYTVPHGCRGGGIWSTPTIEVATSILYIGTGDSTCKKPQNYSDALVALHTSDLSLAGFWQLPPLQQVNDSDFGSTSTLFEATIDGVVHPMIGLVNKNGYYSALDRANLNAGPLWQAHLSQWIDHGHVGKDSISSSAWDGNVLYAGGAQTHIRGTLCPGSLRAIHPATGKFVWGICLSSPVIGAVIAVTGVVVADYGTSIVVVNAASGRILYTYQDPQQNSLFCGSASISNGMLIIGNNDGSLYAFTPNGTPTPTPTSTPSATPTDTPSPTPINS